MTVDRKRVAIVVGAVALACFVLLFFLFGRSGDLDEFVDLRLGYGYDDTFFVWREGVRPADGSGRQIIIGANGVTGDVSPLSAVTEADLLASSIIFESLLIMGQDGYPRGWLAESFSISEDGLTYVFMLQDDVFFSDGELLTPRIVAQSFAEFSRIGVDTVYTAHISRLEGFYDYRMGFVQAISGIQYEINSREISFTFTSARHDNIFAFLAPIINNGVGTGPFVFEVVVGDTIALIVNPRYHKGRPQLDYVFIRMANATSAPIMLENGAIDVFWSDYSENLLNQVEPIANTSIGGFGGNNQGYVGFNLLNGQLANPAVREALVLAVDTTLIKDDQFGPFTAGGGTIVPHFSWLYAQDGGARRVFDPDRARNLLQDAGFEEGVSGFFEKDGRKLTFNLYTINTQAAFNIGSRLAEMWRDIGVDVAVQTLSFGNMREVMASGEFDMLHLSMGVNYDFDFSALSGNNVFLNPFSWEYERASDLASNINSPCPIEARLAFAEWHDIYESSFLRLHLERPKRLIFFNPNLRGLEPYSFGRVVWNIHEWELVG